MTKAEKKELRRSVRNKAAAVLVKLSRTPEEMFPEATPEQLAIVAAELVAVADRIDWGQWAKTEEVPGDA